MLKTSSTRKKRTTKKKATKKAAVPEGVREIPGVRPKRVKAVKVMTDPGEFETGLKRRKVKSKADWVWELKQLPMDKASLTEPERFFAYNLQINHPSAYAAMGRSNAPYKGTRYLPDFTIPVDHPFWEGIVVEIQGGILARRRSGHSSSTGLIRDYAKVTTAQLNHWFILQLPPDADSLVAGCEQLQEIIARFDDENTENDRALAENGWVGE